MNRTIKVPTRFEPDTRFELQPLPFRVRQESRLERLKATLLRDVLEDVWDSEMNSRIRRAANEAAALAWMTAYPLLVLPVLFEEKVAEAVRHQDRQVEIRQRSRELLAI